MSYLNGRTPITELSRPKLAAKARLRVDRRDGRLWLLYPEQGLLLNRTAGETLRLCTGRLTVAAIVDRLAGRHGEDRREAVQADVLRLLDDLSAKGLLDT
ncbi:pyrroloquinoline quinone biosynthesis peptide chaperone PqqD [Nitrospira moscoviensis]|mgnify:FL=1|uniref:Coenzyme PQQ synthesis protein D n=1 Tax=Nitrospira moscoviensis TaxID=42253 RepID=A0A0K2G8C3_NITMO|nr:pyrroloquinoline quinone biosynthesis peptide chaperone PqqD [Nitrospira moscoviensis]ALA57208.1 Coenzyme PQQ synthesis protein D [Nitrospira moscoviensis]